MQGAGLKTETIETQNFNYHEKRKDPIHSGMININKMRSDSSHKQSTYTLEIVKLDDVYKEPRLDLIKIDIEGMEAEAIKGAAKIIKKTDLGFM